MHPYEEQFSYVLTDELARARCALSISNMKSVAKPLENIKNLISNISFQNHKVYGGVYSYVG